MGNAEEKEQGMPAIRLIFSTGSLYLLDLAQCFALAAESGCDGVEVMCDDRWSTRDPGYVRTLSDQYQLPVLVLHTPFSASVRGWREPERELARIEQTLVLAEQLRAETIVVHLPPTVGWGSLNLPPWRVRLPWFSRAAEVTRCTQRELAVRQRQTGVRIAEHAHNIGRWVGGQSTLLNTCDGRKHRLP